MSWAIASCEFLDPASNAWMAGPPMNNPPMWHSLSVLDGELWAVGGKSQNNEEVRSCERLDAATNKWIVGPDFFHVCAVF